MQDIEQTKELVQTQPLSVAEPIKSFDPEREIDNAQKAAKALMRVIDVTKPLVMNDKRYLYFEHWQTIGQFFGQTTGTETCRELVDDNGQFYGYEAKAVVYNTNGIIVGSAEAMCTVDEEKSKRDGSVYYPWADKPKFQLRSMAQTRAMAKALRSKFGFIAVLAGVEATPAEEMEGGERVGAVRKGSWDKKPSAPSDKQKGLIDKLMRDKGITIEDIIDAGFDYDNLTGGKEGTASELIDYLLKTPNKIINGQVIPQKIDPELQSLGESVPF